MIFLLILLLGVPLVFFTIGALISAPSYKGSTSDHFDGQKFTNPTGIKGKGFGEVIKWMTNRKRGAWKENTTPGYGKHPVAREKGGIRITFVNHSTFLIQVDGLNILTDPIWSKRTSPFSFAGPKRMKFPGIRFEDLPKIDAVLISHNHYDHLDVATMRTVFGAFHPKIFTPLGVKEFLDSESITGATDMDWWDEIKISDSISLQSVPAQHFSGRGMLDRDETLWCGYVLKTSKGNIYFAGDTGYNDVTFKEIGERIGEMKISMIPIGAYKPEWFMSPIHVSPEEAVKIHMDVNSKTSIGMHFGTFPLADDGYEDPVTDLKRGRDKFNVAVDRFIVLNEGECYVE